MSRPRVTMQPSGATLAFRHLFSSDKSESPCKCVKEARLRTRQMIMGSFAVKVVPRLKEREFLAERHALSILSSHPHIPRCLFAGHNTAGTDFLLALELGVGGDVLSLVERMDHISEQQAAPIFLQVLSAVHFAHQNNIVHRDIKLENLVFTDESHTRVLLIDWGISSRFSPTQTLHEDCGSLHYASPELLTGIPYIGPEVDSWALGVLLFTMLAGYFPFGGENVAKKRLGILVPLSFPRYFSPSVCSLI
ncbi:MAG: protein kinase, partial [Cyanobacteria bacterium]|nr:protein kinase [Cyanobacteriota bacterium]